MPHLPRVLIVDDEPATAEYLTLTVRALGYGAVTALDGSAAVESAIATRPDLILLDALLPKLDGFHVLERIREADPAIPVVMMSGIYRKRSYQADAVGRLGAKAYLLKPLSVLRVWEVLDEHLGPPPAGIAPEGLPGAPFSEDPLPAVVAGLHARRATGLLFVRTPESSAIISFVNGAIVFARGSDASARLDRILLEAGVPEQTLARVAAIAGPALARRTLGELLVGHGLISGEQLRQALGRQQQLLVTRPFTWAEGTSHFFPTDAPCQEPSQLAFDVPALVAWGCRQLADDERLERWLASPRRRLKMKDGLADQAERLGLDAREIELLATCDGTRDVAAVRAVGRSAQLDVNRLLAIAKCFDLADEAEAPARQVPAALPTSGGIVPAAGDFSLVAPARLLVRLQLAGRTGRLEVDSATGGERWTRSLLFDGGLVAYGSSSSLGDRLGEVLVASQKISRAELDAALAITAQRRDVRLGRVLVEQGVLRLTDLHDALEGQLRQAVAAIVGAREGTFALRTDSPPPPQVPAYLDTTALVLETLRRAATAELAGDLPALPGRFKHSPACRELRGTLPLLAAEEAALDWAEGDGALQEARSGDGSTPARATLRLLLELGLLEAWHPSQDESPEVAARTVHVRGPVLGTPVRAAPAPPAAPDPLVHVSTEGTPAVAETGDFSFGFLEQPPAEAAEFEPADLFAGMSMDTGTLQSDQPPSGLPPATAGGVLAGDFAGAVDAALEEAFGFDLLPSARAGEQGALPATGAAAAVAPGPRAAAALLEEPTVASQSSDMAAIDRFLEALAEQVGGGAARVPASVLALLPPWARRQFPGS